MPAAPRAVLDQLRSTFTAAFGDPVGTRLVRAPGRVNLMGDHVDYLGLPVLPAALGRSAWMLVRPRDDARVRVSDVRVEFGQREFEVSPEIAPGPAGDWGNYLRASAQALEGRLGELTGYDAALASELPVASGLSSSSALVIASALALLDANGLAMDPLELAALMADAERYVGTHGGGMDQAVILAARAGTATRIGFEPLRAEHVRVPADWRILVAHSLVSAEKAGASRGEYNRRPAEAREALALLAPHLQPAGVAWTWPRLLLTVDPDRVLTLAASHLTPLLGRRCRHVVTEALRVEAMVEAMQGNSVVMAGELMSESHRSLRDDLETSTPEVDGLVDALLEAGAAGARLTGAGFGGSVVALTTASREPAVRAALADRWYGPRGVGGERFEEACFVMTPAGGAEVGHAA